MADALWLEKDFGYDRTQRQSKQRQEYLGLQVAHPQPAVVSTLGKAGTEAASSLCSVTGVCAGGAPGPLAPGCPEQCCLLIPQFPQPSG